MRLERTPLLLERARPSVTNKPKARTRRIDTSRQNGETRRSLLSRITRRVRERATPLFREIARGVTQIRQKRQKNEKPLVKGQVAPRKRMLRGHRL